MTGRAARRRPVERRRAVLLVAMVAATAAMTRPAPGDGAVPGSAGTDTALPATDSQVTVGGRDRFAGLRITVNQTRNLANQAVSVTWTGAVPTRSGPGRFAAHYLQVMQCWGEDDGAVPGNPGPPPEQCVQGATDAVYGGRNSGIFPAGGFALERIVARRDWPGFDPAAGVLDERTGFVWKPFRAVDGTVVATQYDPDFNPAVVGGNYWLNPFFNAITTNEIAAGRTGGGGSGSDLFEVTTGVESPGLGCGQAVQPVQGGDARVPRCWLVVVPRGTPSDENVGTPYAGNADQVGVFTSPLSPGAWRNRIAVPLEFNPVDSPCDLGADQRPLLGSEMFLAATGSWQHRLCSVPGLPSYTFGVVGDARARQLLAAGGQGAPGMIVVSRPLDPAQVDPESPVVYAPLALSGVVIGFNVERDPRLDSGPSAELLRGVRVADLNLTPRLVAKLLTQSYRSQVTIKAVAPPAGYGWVADNPAHLGKDPDFLRFNREFELLQIANGKNFGGLMMASRSSDVSHQVWEWVFADPEAKAWLDGAPDEWGMRVNPVYATSAAANPAGVPFGDPVPDSFPKSDPYCYQGPRQGAGGSVLPPLLCGTDWLPYAQSLRDAARMTRAADDGARTTEDPFAISAERVYRPDGPQPLGSRSILSVTDSPSASLYGLQAARLSRSGDNGPDRSFVAPTTAGLLAGADAMRPQAVAAVREPDPAATAPGAYPLTAVSYAAIRPLSLTERARLDYAAFAAYAAGDGQSPGRQLGQLPPGYAPLPAALRAQAAEAATSIRALQPPPAPTTPAATGAGPVVVPEVSGDSVAPAAAGSEPVALAPRPQAGGPVATPAPYPPLGAGGGAGATAPAPSGPAPATAAAPASPGATGVTGAVRFPLTRLAVPVLAGIALLAALGALEITARPRRAPAGAGRQEAW